MSWNFVIILCSILMFSIALLARYSQKAVRFLCKGKWWYGSEHTVIDIKGLQRLYFWVYTLYGTALLITTLIFDYFGIELSGVLILIATASSIHVSIAQSKYITYKQ